jgi:hypothetical protein
MKWTYRQWSIETMAGCMISGFLALETFILKEIDNLSFSIYLFCGTCIWTQGLHLEPLHQPFFFLILIFLLFICAYNAWVISPPCSPPPTAPLPALLCKGFFQDRVSWTLCPGWPQTMIVLISASWIVRITGVRHQRPGGFFFCCCCLLNLSVCLCTYLSVCLSIYLECEILLP